MLQILIGTSIMLQSWLVQVSCYNPDLYKYDVTVLTGTSIMLQSWLLQVSCYNSGWYKLTCYNPDWCSIMLQSWLVQVSCYNPDWYKLKLKLARLHPIRARASYRPVGLALWDSWGELIPKSFLVQVSCYNSDWYKYHITILIGPNIMLQYVGIISLTNSIFLSTLDCYSLWLKMHRPFHICSKETYQFLINCSCLGNF
jgi:hypothetical protein